MSTRGWIRRALGTGLGVVVLLGVAPLTTAHAAVPVLVLDGTGYGHGVGLSQWGAEYLARMGRSTDQILATFYPGTTLSQATGPVRVAVHKPVANTATLSFPQGGEIRSAREGGQAPGFPVRVGPGGRVRITFDGSYRVEALVAALAATRATPYRDDPCPLLVACTPPTTLPAPSPTTTTTTAAPPPTSPSSPPAGGTVPGGTESPGTTGAPAGSGTATSSSPVWSVPAQSGVTTVDERGRSYRGVIEATGGAALRFVNELGIDEYLRGMAEVPGTWPAAAVQSQTIAARTYALRAMQSGGELCDDQRCQVYVGRTAETRGQDAAVAATTKRVVTFNGSLAAAVYSADAGGVSATTFEGFGTPDGVYPYLKTVQYDTDNPLPWHLEVALSDVAARLRYRGTLTGVRVGSSGPSGRALGLVLEGTSGESPVDGRAFASALGLRSTRFSLSIGSSDGAPPPPPPAEEAIQGLPEEAAAMAQRPIRAADVMAGRRGMSSAGPEIAGRPDALRSARHLRLLLTLMVLAGLTGAGLPLLLASDVTVESLQNRFRRGSP